MDKKSKIYVAGHLGLVGSAITRRLRSGGFENLICRSIEELDLCDQGAVARFFQEERPEFVFLAAARVGGIVANSSYPAQFIYDNLMIQNNVIHQAWLSGVNRLLFLGSSCIYPRLAPQPLREEYLMTGPLEPTNEPYAMAKIAGISLCRAYNRQYGTRFLAAMPTNLYGTNDNFNLETSHVLPALIRKFHEAKEENDEKVEIWGTGKPQREFLHVDDLADAAVFLMSLADQAFQDLLFPDSRSPEPAPPALINIGTGEEVSIRELAELVKETVAFQGQLAFDSTKPDGTPRKLIDSARLHDLGWKHRISLAEGIRGTYDWFVENWRSPGKGGADGL